MAVTLLVCSGKRAGARLALPPQKLVVGRGEDCDIRFNSDAVSRHHCCLHVTDKTLEVEDLGSQNGTRVNDVPVQGRVALKSNDLLLIGNMQFQVLLQPAKAVRDKTTDKPTTDDDIANWLQNESKTGMNSDTAVLTPDQPTSNPPAPPAEPEPVKPEKPHNPLVDQAAEAIRRYRRNLK